MNPQALEKLLREKVATEKPRPGFETRIQAMAREPRMPKKSPLPRWIALGGLSAVALTILTPRDKAAPRIVETRPQPGPPVEVKIVETETALTAPVHKEIEGMKNDARRAWDFLSGAVPSMTVK